MMILGIDDQGQNYKVEYNFVRNCFKKNDNNKCDSELNIEEMVL